MAYFSIQKNNSVIYQTFLSFTLPWNVPLIPQTPSSGTNFLQSTAVRPGNPAGAQWGFR